MLENESILRVILSAKTKRSHDTMAIFLLFCVCHLMLLFSDPICHWNQCHQTFPGCTIPIQLNSCYIYRIQSNLCLMTTLRSHKEWPLLWRGRSLCYKILKCRIKIVVKAGGYYSGLVVSLDLKNVLGRNSQNFLCKFLIIFVTSGLKMLRL